jgi:hypothetical protein
MNFGHCILEVNVRYLREPDGRSRRTSLKNSNFRVDHNSEDRWQP